MGEKIIGYFGIIPTKVHWENKLKDAFWWIDLIVSKEYRGKGYQSIVDDYIRNRPEIKRGFPNKFAAKIHKKHNWRIFDHLKIMLFPIKPSKSSIVDEKSSLFGAILNILVIPLVHVRKHKSPRWSYIDIHPKFDEYAQLFKSTRSGQVTIKKDLDFFKWRYLDSPYSHEYEYYFCHKSIETQIALILRKVQTDQGLNIRILDMFGSLKDSAAVKDMIKLVISDAIKFGANQITIMESNKLLQKILFSMGFIFFTKARFCYYKEGRKNIRIQPIMRWTLSDSDNDFLD